MVCKQSKPLFFQACILFLFSSHSRTLWRGFVLRWQQLVFLQDAFAFHRTYLKVRSNLHWEYLQTFLQIVFVLLKPFLLVRDLPLDRPGNIQDFSRHFTWSTLQHLKIFVKNYKIKLGKKKKIPKVNGWCNILRSLNRGYSLKNLSRYQRWLSYDKLKLVQLAGILIKETNTTRWMVSKPRHSVQKSIS